MKFVMPLLITTLLIAGCSTAPSSAGVKVDRLVQPDVVGYTKAEQRKAHDERKQHCSTVPVMCHMVNDYGRMRDQARAGRGEKINIGR